MYSIDGGKMTNLFVVFTCWHFAVVVVIVIAFIMIVLVHL